MDGYWHLWLAVLGLFSGCDGMAERGISAIAAAESAGTELRRDCRAISYIRACAARSGGDRSHAHMSPDDRMSPEDKYHMRRRFLGEL